MRSIALPQAAPSRGSQSWRVGHTARGSTRLQDCNKCKTGNLRLLSPVWLSPEASADTERRDQHIRAPRDSAAGAFRRRMPEASACCRAPDSRVLRGAAIQGPIRPGCAPTLQTPTCGRREQTRRHERRVCGVCMRPCRPAALTIRRVCRRAGRSQKTLRTSRAHA